ncbi:hypothetical protein F5883DRAFT_655898 [Diaporthe sp. PMI_573]|nr:hypothetical protein F5883DRAFT_655898 [Diaporthaceae sp. PMI_573]
MDLEGVKDTQCLQDRLYASLGSSFWQNHEESPKLLQWVRTVDAIHKWLEESKEHYGRFIQRHNREMENFHLPDNYIHEQYGDVYRYLEAMSPYLPEKFRNETHDGSLEECVNLSGQSQWTSTDSWIFAAAASGAIWFPVAGRGGLDGHRSYSSSY